MPFIALIQDLLSLLTRTATSAIQSLSCILFRVLPYFKLEALTNLHFEKFKRRALFTSPTQIFQNTKILFLFSCHKGYAISIRLAKSECFESFKYLFRNTVNSKFLFRIVNYATHIWEPETVDNKSNSRVTRTS